MKSHKFTLRLLIIVVISILLLFFISYHLTIKAQAHVSESELTSNLYLPLINKFLTPIPTPTPAPVTPGNLVFHQADESIEYNWFSYVPKSINKSHSSYIWVSGLHGNLITDDYDQITNESRNQAEWRTSLAESHNLILLVPVIPRPDTDYVYVVAYPWEVFLESTPSFLRRPDFKLNLMLDRLMGDLRARGYGIQDKIFIDGFSAGAMFAQRYALLHPGRVKALAAGQCGGALTFPESGYDNTEMDWPVGVNDFASMAGYQFDRQSYKQVAQFIYIGDKDNNNSTLLSTGELWRTQEQIDFLNKNFGNSDPVRLQNQVAYLQSIGYNNMAFKLYPGIGHQLTDAMLSDVFKFFDDHK